MVVNEFGQSHDALHGSIYNKFAVHWRKKIALLSVLEYDEKIVAVCKIAIHMQLYKFTNALEY